MTGNNRKGIVLQERDRHLLRELSTLRIVDRDQAKIAAGFGSDSRANRRLYSLTVAGLLRRFFLGANAPGRKAVYSLSRKGALLAGVPYRSFQRRADESLVADFGVHHQLSVNELHLSLKYRPVLPPRVTFEEWRAFHKPLAPGVRLIPDGYFVLTGPTRTVAAFVEIDLGHERREVWREKVRKYAEFAMSGTYPRIFGREQFRVLVATTTERRLRSLQTTVSSITAKIFWFTTLDTLRHEGPCASIWRRSRDGASEPLIPESRP